MLDYESDLADLWQALRSFVRLMIAGVFIGFVLLFSVVAWMAYLYH